MKLLRDLAAGWDRFWFAPLPVAPAAALRIVLGLLIVAHFACSLPSWVRFYDGDAMLSLHDPTVTAVPQGWWSVFWWTEDVLPVMVYWWAGMAAALAFTLGWHTRIACVVLFAIVASTVHRNPMVVNGEDLVFRMLLFFSCFAALGSGWSLDRAVGRAPRGTPRVWPLRLIQLDICLLYLFSQSWKVVEDPLWLAGDAMYYTMINATWSRWPWPEIFYHPFVAHLTTWGSLGLELAFPLLVWWRPVRLPIILAMSLLHVSIAIVLSNVTFFSLSMPCAFIAFIDARDVERIRGWGAAVATRFGSRPAPASGPTTAPSSRS